MVIWLIFSSVLFVRKGRRIKGDISIMGLRYISHNNSNTEAYQIG